MRQDDQVRITNALAMAIEYMAKFAHSALARVVTSELRAAIAIVSNETARETAAIARLDADREAVERVTWETR